MEVKKEIEGALAFVDREGVGSLIEFLASSDFYTAPCSTKFHLAVPGGLAQHTLNVMACAMRINKNYEEVCKPESVILAAVGHDLCKVGFYKEVDEPPTDPQLKYLTSLLVKAGLPRPSRLNKAYAGRLIDFLLKEHKPGMKLPEFVHQYEVADQLPLGHGEKSLLVMQRYVKLTDEEALSIRWHMATFDPAIHFPYPYGFAYNEALKKTKLVSILVLADFEASNLVED